MQPTICRRGSNRKSGSEISIRTDTKSTFPHQITSSVHLCLTQKAKSCQGFTALEIRLGFRQKAGDSPGASSGGKASCPGRGHSAPPTSASSAAVSSLQPWSHQEKTQRGGSVWSDTTSPSLASRTTHHILPFAKGAAILFKQIWMHFKAHGKKTKPIRDVEIYDARLCLNALFLLASLCSRTFITNKNIHWSTNVFLQENLPLWHHRLHRKLPPQDPIACESVKNPFKAHLLSKSKG